MPRMIELVGCVLAAAALSGPVSCAGTTSQSLVDGDLIVPLAALITRPELLSSGQQITVQGYFSKGVGPLLFLTSEHAAAFDTISAIAVVDPTEDGSLTQADCFDRFVTVHGTFVRHNSGETTIQNVSEVEYRSQSAAESRDWAHLFVTCWPVPHAAQHAVEPD